MTITISEIECTSITLIVKQRLYDGNLPTCNQPNPDNKEVLALVIEYAKINNSYLILATNHGCDLVCIVVKDKNGEYHLLNGNGGLIASLRLHMLTDSETWKHTCTPGNG